MIIKDAKDIVAFIQGWQCGIRTIPEKNRTDRQNSVLETLVTIEAYATLTEEVKQLQL